MKHFLKKTHDLFWVAFPLILSVIFVLVFLKAAFPDADTFFIINTGRYIVENGVVPTVNPFVIHDGFGIIVQQWLFDVLIYHIYNIGGNLGLYLYSVIILLISLVMMYKFFGFYSKNTPLKMLLLAFCAAIASFFVVVRPTSLSFLLCLSVVMVMEAYRRDRNQKILLLLPILSLATINIHASMWPILFVLMVPFIFPDRLPKEKELGFGKSLVTFITEWFGKWRWVLFAMVGMFLVGFINPNGLKGMAYLLYSYDSAISGDFILELRAPTLTSFIGLLVVGATLLLFMYMFKNKGQMDFAKFYMAAGTTILAAMHNRNLWFLFFGTIPLFFVFFDKFTWNMGKKEKSTGIYAALNICYLCIVFVLLLLPMGYDSLEITDDDSTPVEAVSYLNSLDEADRAEVVLYNEFNNGAYLEFQGYKVYMDARPELFQSKVNGKADVYTEYLMARVGEVDFAEFFDKYQFTHLLVEDGTALSGFLRAYEGANMIVDGNGYKLFSLER